MKRTLVTCDGPCGREITTPLPLRVQISRGAVQAEELHFCKTCFPLTLVKLVKLVIDGRDESRLILEELFGADVGAPAPSHVTEYITEPAGSPNAHQRGTSDEEHAAHLSRVDPRPYPKPKGEKP